MAGEQPSRAFQVVLETPDGDRTFECAEDDYVWYAAANAGVSLPYMCLQGRCLSCAGKLLDGQVDQSSADLIYPEDKADGFVLLCRASPRSNVRIRTHQAESMRASRLAHGLPAPYA
jgi:ferredoxin